MASLDFEAEKTIFREYYNDNRLRLLDAQEFFRSLIATLAGQLPEVEKPLVTARLKDRDECIAKFSRKYQASLEASKTEYSIAAHITDLIGIRIVCLYENEVETVVKTLRDNFFVLEESNKIEKVESTENTFGYKGFHLDLKVNDARLELPEYSRFGDLRFEVQVRTTIQDAWSALDHKIKYKKSIPPNLKRRINTLAALFELADHEFLSIRKKTQELLSEAEDTAPLIAENEQPTASVGSDRLRLDVFTFLSVVKERFPDYTFLPHAADGFVQDLLQLKSTLTSIELASVLERYLEKVKEYRLQSRHALNPYTQIRHSLYLESRDTFGAVLFDKQREQFELWLSRQEQK